MVDGGRNSILVAVGSSIEPADLPSLCAIVRSRLERSRAAVVVIDLGGVGAPDGVTIDAMARLVVVARRLGCRVELRDAPVELMELLAFTGLHDTLTDTLSGTLTGAAGRSSLVLHGETEEGEDPLDVEEEGQLDDPAV